MSQFKGKKMTFDEYEHKLSKPNNSSSNKTSKRPIVQRARLVEKGKTVTTAKHQKLQKSIRNTNGRSLNISDINQSEMVDENQSNMTIINQSSLRVSTNPIDSYSQPSLTQTFTANNHLKSHEVTRESIPAPVSHQFPDNKQTLKNQPQSMGSETQEVNKIDLIFEKQPEDVQKKLRSLLLNYNAVMQYNQNQDKFQVDLLLPFNTPQEKQLFIQKFMKTRHYLSQQIQQDRINQQPTYQQLIPNHDYSSNTSSHQFHPNNPSNNQIPQQRNLTSNQSNTLYARSNSNHSSINQHSNHSQVQHTNILTKPSHNQSKHDANNILNTSLRKQAQTINSDQELNETDHKIDFFTLSQSLDVSIQKGLTLIGQQKIIEMSKSSSTHQMAQQKQIQQTGKEKEKHNNQKSLSKDQPLHIQKTQLNAFIQRKSQVDQFRQPASQIESQISEGHKPNIPHSMQLNYLNTASGKKNHQQSAWMRPLQPNESQSFLANSSLDYSHEENTRMIKPSGSSLYESPIIPVKNPDFHDRNNTSNEILIQDLDDQYDIEGYQTPDRTKYRHADYEMEQQSYNSAFDMIEQTAEEYEDQLFPSSLEYKEFLKKKIHDTNVRSGSKQKNKPKYPIHLSKEQSHHGYPKETSLRAKYSQFLNKNHKKIESLYLRIGRQMKKKRQQQLHEFQNAAQKGKQQAVRQILVADDDIEEMSEKDESLLEGYKKRIVLENDSMSSQDKVRYFRYLAKHAKGLYIEFIKSQNTSKRNHN